MTIIELGKKFAELKAQHYEKSKELAVLTKEWEEVETELQTAMIDEGVNSISIEGIGQLSMRTRNYLSVNTANKEQFFQYLQESGNGSLLKLDVNPRTLTAFLSEHLEELIAKRTQEGVDAIDARNAMLEFLNQKGANYFTKRDIALKRG